MAGFWNSHSQATSHVTREPGVRQTLCEGLWCSGHRQGGTELQKLETSHSPYKGPPWSLGNLDVLSNPPADADEGPLQMFTCHFSSAAKHLLPTESYNSVQECVREENSNLTTSTIRSLCSLIVYEMCVSHQICNSNFNV